MTTTGVSRRDPLRGLATALAVAAVVSTVGAGAVVAVRGPDSTAAGDDPTSQPTGSVSGAVTEPDPAPSPSIFDDGQISRDGVSGNVVMEVPGEKSGWKNFGVGTWYEIDAVMDGPKPRIVDPYYNDVGFCPGEKDSARAAIGFGVPILDSDDVPAANQLLVDVWTAALKEREGNVGTPQVQGPAPVQLADGSTGQRSVISFRQKPDPCLPGRSEITIVSLDTGPNVGSVIAYRDVGDDGYPTAALVERVLTSARAG